LIDDVIDYAEKGASEEAALILGQKAFYHFLNSNNSDASYYADLALKKSRDIESSRAETKALIIKGYLCDVRKEHKKTSAWYTMALSKCTKLQRPGLLLDLGTSLSKQGEYRQAWTLIKEAELLAVGLSTDKSIDNIERASQKKILTKTHSRLAPVLEGIGDFDAALRSYDQALALSKENRFMHEIYKIYSRKTKLLIMLEQFNEAEDTLKKAEKVLYENSIQDPKSFLYLAHDWARLYKNSKRYKEAFKKYEEILFDGLDDGLDYSDRLNYFMDNQADIFSEILVGVAECLRAKGRIVDSDSVYDDEARFSELKQQTGIYSEIDRTYKLDMQKKRIRTLLKRIFLNEPDSVEYKNIRARYDYTEDKTIFNIGKKEIKRSKRYFLVFKCLVENAGKCVSGKMLDRYVIEQGESLNEYDSGLRSYVWRLKKEIKLDQFLEQCSGFEGKGWKLKKP